MAKWYHYEAKHYHFARWRLGLGRAVKTDTNTTSSYYSDFDYHPCYILGLVLLRLNRDSRPVVPTQTSTVFMPYIDPPNTPTITLTEYLTRTATTTPPTETPTLLPTESPPTPTNTATLTPPTLTEPPPQKPRLRLTCPRMHLNPAKHPCQARSR